MNFQEFIDAYQLISNQLLYANELRSTWISLGKDPEQQNLAIKKKQSDLLDQLKNNQLSVGTESDYNTLMLWACKNGHSEVVSVLLESGKANPAANENEALSLATENGFTAIVDLLLKDNRVKPGASQEKALLNAAKKGYFEIVQLLLNNGHVPPSDNLTAFFQNALNYPEVSKPERAQSDHLATSRLLLSNLKVQGKPLSNLFSDIEDNNKFKEQIYQYINDPNLFIFSKFAQKSDFTAMKAFFAALPDDKKEELALAIFQAGNVGMRFSRTLI